MNLRVTKYKFSFLIVMLISVNLLSQSNPKLSNYEFSPLIYNPAFAGSDDGLTISSVYSTQWMGFEGAPETQFFAIHSMVKPKIGVGIEIFNDKIGATKETKLLANFAYKIKNKQHAIMEGLDDFSLESELYLMEAKPPYEVLLSCDYQGFERPIAWVKPYGLGRVFYLALGHNTQELDCQAVQKIILNSVYWAAN